MFSSIVVGTDGSETAAAAVARAAELAKLCDAQLHVVTAFKPITEMVLSPEAMVDLSALVDPRNDATEICKKAAGAVAGGCKVEAHICAGNAADALIEVAEQQGADLIVVGSRGMRGARRMLGSVPNAVSHHAPCTVMIVQTG